jgi:hypothetical protein
MPDNSEIEIAVRKLSEESQPPEQLKEAIAHYRRTGTFRPEDLRRILGDPTKGVGMTSGEIAESFFSL